MLSNNLLLTIVIVLLVISEYNKNKKIESLNSKLETFKNENRENFNSSIQSIDSVSIKNLSTLASNLISSNGNQLNLNFSNVDFNSVDQGEKLSLNFKKVNIHAFRGMVCPFYIEYSSEIEHQRLIDSDWYPCDGKDNRPNLNEGRFVLGGINKGDTGGEASVSLTINEMPSHTHQMKAGTTTNNYCRKSSAKCGVQMSDGWAQKDGDRSRVFPATGDTNPLSQILSTGGSQPHNNMPPYLVISYWIYLPPQ